MCMQSRSLAQLWSAMTASWEHLSPAPRADAASSHVGPSRATFLPTPQTSVPGNPLPPPPPALPSQPCHSQLLPCADSSQPCWPPLAALPCPLTESKGLWLPSSHGDPWDLLSRPCPVLWAQPLSRLPGCPSTLQGVFRSPAGATLQAAGQTFQMTPTQEACWACTTGLRAPPSTLSLPDAALPCLGSGASRLGAPPLPHRVAPLPRQETTPLAGPCLDVPLLAAALI